MTALIRIYATTVGRLQPLILGSACRAQGTTRGAGRPFFCGTRGAGPLGAAALGAAALGAAALGAAALGAAALGAAALGAAALGAAALGVAALGAAALGVAAWTLGAAALRWYRSAHRSAPRGAVVRAQKQRLLSTIAAPPWLPARSSTTPRQKHRAQTKKTIPHKANLRDVAVEGAQAAVERSSITTPAGRGRGPHRLPAPGQRAGARPTPA